MLATYENSFSGTSLPAGTPFGTPMGTPQTPHGHNVNLAPVRSGGPRLHLGEYLKASPLMHTVTQALRLLSAKLLPVILLAILLPFAASAQDDDKPTVGILRFGFYPTNYWMTGAVLNLLELYGWIDEADKAALRQGEDLENERLSIFWGDAGFDFNNATLLIDAALDRQPDALITFSTPPDSNRRQPDPPAGSAARADLRRCL